MRTMVTTSTLPRQISLSCSPTNSMTTMSPKMMTSLQTKWIMMISLTNHRKITNRRRLFTTMPIRPTWMVNQGSLTIWVTRSTKKITTITRRSRMKLNRSRVILRMPKRIFKLPINRNCKNNKHNNSQSCKTSRS